MFFPLFSKAKKVEQKVLFSTSSKEVNDTTELLKIVKFEGVITADKAYDFILSIYFSQVNNSQSLD